MKNRTNTRWLTQLALLVAVLLVMNYTPLGYLQVGPLSMSLLTIPVAIGAMTLGPVAGAILGGVFGTTSFVSALRTPSVMSAAMLQASPVGTFITCFVARVLVGLCAGWVYIGIKKLLPKSTKLCCAVGAVATPLLNTFWFMLSLCVFFFNTEYVQSLCATFGTTNPFLFVCAFVGVQALIDYDDTHAKYSVGEIGNGMKYTIERASVVREIQAVEGSKLIFKKVLPLMGVEFVRYGMLTVVPFPFKYLREYIVKEEKSV